MLKKSLYDMPRPSVLIQLLHIEEWFPAWELKEILRNNQLKSDTKRNGPSIDFFIFQAR